MIPAGKHTLRISSFCLAIALPALIILPLASAHRPLHAQSPTPESVLYIFNKADGYNPSGIFRDALGNFYLTTESGGNNLACFKGCGTILKVNPSGVATVLHSFSPAPFSPGPLPNGLTSNAKGILYGTTMAGGRNRLSFGSLFEFAPSGVEETLYSFAGGSDGANPSSGLLTLDSAGNLYGATFYGGGTGCGGGGCGEIYRVTPTGGKSTLYSFTGGADGRYPVAGLLLDSAGSLYGVAKMGGNLACNANYGCGTVWKLDPAGNLTVLHTFLAAPDGASPEAGLIIDPFRKPIRNHERWRGRRMQSHQWLRRRFQDRFQR